MFRNTHKLRVSATALALLGCYGAWLSSEPARELAAPPPELELQPQAPAPAARVRAPVAPAPNTAASNSMLSELSARLGDLEAQLNVQTKAASEASVAAPPSGSEPALADWMLAAIRGEEWDRAHTEKVEAELSATLEQAPELHAQELECGRRFCRALLIDRRGTDVALQPLFGAPPFDGEGFTTIGQGGKAEIYFTRPGQSLDALQKEAQL